MIKKIDIYYFMMCYLGIILLWGSFAAGGLEYLARGLIVLIIYVFFDLFWTRVRAGIWYNPSSSVISGLVLSIVGATNASWIIVILLPLIAALSKQLIKMPGLGRHIFNPAAFSITILAILGYSSAGWWGVAWGQEIFYFVLFAGIFILWRQKRFDSALTFLVFYALLITTRIFDGTIIFFSTVMLIEPMTSNFQSTRNNVIYGITVALAAFAASMVNWGLDPLLAGLLTGNLILSSLLATKIIR